MSNSFNVNDLAQNFLTIQDVVRFGASEFTRAGLVYGHGTTSAVEEAIFITLETLHLPVNDPGTFWTAQLTLNERTEVLSRMVARIETRRPAPYIVGRAYIQGYGFRVTDDVIVPRSYLGEILTSGRIFDQLPFGDDVRQVRRILDLCTGSGCLAILAAEVFPDAQVDAVDLSPAALAVAAANVADYNLSDRISLLEGDLFAPLAGRRYDLILTNPPYVRADAVAAFPPEYRAEPEMAHQGGVDGMDLVRRILDAADAHLMPEGGMLTEIGSGRAALADHAATERLEWIETENSNGEVFWYRS